MEAGISNDVVTRFAPRIPLLGVCLGHQCIGHALGAKVVRAGRIMHGKTSWIHHDGHGIYRGIANPFEATRYHSLVIEPGTLPDELEVVAWTDQNEIMGVRHKRYPLEGVQYHPESFLTLEGIKLLKNFLEQEPSERVGSRCRVVQPTRDARGVVGCTHPTIRPETGPMLSIGEALDAVISEARALAPAVVRLEDALGCVLAEDVKADVDSPPFDKALVDGYAVRTADLEGTEPALTIGELITAGRNPSRALGSREAAVIMTGAPIPPGCDAVVMHERTRTHDGVVMFEQAPIKPGQNVLPRGAEMRAGEVVLARGLVLRPAQLGVLASVGRTDVTRHSPAACRDRPDRRRAGRAGRSARARSDPQLERRHASRPGGRIRRDRRHAADRARRARRAGKALEPGARGRRGAGDRRRFGRPARSRTGVAGVARSAQGLPQDQPEAGQAALVRRRGRREMAALVPSSSDCRATRSAVSSDSCCSSGRRSLLWPADPWSVSACWTSSWRAASPSAAIASPIFRRAWCRPQARAPRACVRSKLSTGPARPICARSPPPTALPSFPRETATTYREKLWNSCPMRPGTN